MRDSTGDVAVFWDLDTCSIYPPTSGYDVVGKIRSLSQNLGTVRSFKGYADLARLGVPSALHLRSELQSSGVSLIDCPATERRSIASKTMIVDILAHAADNPPPTTLLVIAGNDDFSYAVSILQLRQYQVVLVCPKDRVGQHSQASLYLDWFRDVIGSDPVIDDGPQISRGSRCSRSNTISTVSTTPGALRRVTTPEPLDTGPPFSYSTQSSEGSIFQEDPADPIPHYPNVVDEKDGEETRIAGASVEVIPPATVDDIPQSQNQIRLDSPTPSIFVEIQHRPSSAPPSYSSFSPAPSPSSQDLYGAIGSGAFRLPQYPQDGTQGSEIWDDFEDSDRLISQPQSPGSTSASTITPWNRADSPNSTSTTLPTSQARLSPDSRVTVLPNTSQADPVSPSPASFSTLPSLVQTPNLSPQIIPDSVRPSPPGTPLGIPSTSVSLREPQTTSATLPLSQPMSVPLPVPFAPSQPTSMPSPTCELTTVSARIPTPAPAPARISTPTPISAPGLTRVPTPAPSGSTSQSTPTKPPAQAHPPAPKIVPPQFQLLVKKLQERRDKGDLKPFRPGLAAEMVSVLSKEMQKVGVSTFTQFAQLAQQNGIVELPQPGEGLWIALRPELHKYHFQ